MPRGVTPKTTEFFSGKLRALEDYGGGPGWRRVDGSEAKGELFFLSSTDYQKKLGLMRGEELLQKGSYQERNQTGEGQISELRRLT